MRNASPLEHTGQFFGIRVENRHAETPQFVDESRPRTPAESGRLAQREPSHFEQLHREKQSSYPRFHEGG